MSEIIRFQLELPAVHRFLNVLSGCLSELLSRIDGIENRDAVVYQLQLAAQEVCANIVDHAYEGRTGERLTVGIEVDEAAGWLRATFVDTGRAFDPRSAPDAIDAPSEGGMGLFLIEQLVDQVEYRRESDRNLWIITKTLV